MNYSMFVQKLNFVHIYTPYQRQKNVNLGLLTVNIFFSNNIFFILKRNTTATAKKKSFCITVHERKFCNILSVFN